MMRNQDLGSNSGDPCQVDSSSDPQISGNRKLFWRSASWSSSRTGLQRHEEEGLVDPNGASGQHRRFPVPLTPRAHTSSKSRACLPPLQPLSIARRSLDEWPRAGSDDIGEWLQPTTPSGRSDANKNGERLKLDMSVIQQEPEKNGGLVRRDKIAFFDKKCSKVAEHIYLGGDAVAKDRNILKQNGITHILNCVGFVCPEYFKADFAYRTLWLQDSPSEDITSILYDVFDYFEDVREQGGKVFVHCCQGVSRSTSLVIAYLMWREGQSFDDAFQYVKAARGIADPNMGFACQLLQCQKRVHAIPLSPSSLLRIYRIAPHSPYDPLHLVPKLLNDPSPRALDSRGAFIIHIPSAIYVWIGKSCETIIERDARGAACQIVRYEKVQGPVSTVSEGEEPAYFWDAFSNLMPLMDKCGENFIVGDSLVKTRPDERIVESYNVDFEIIRKAIKGGFVPPFTSSGTEHEMRLPARESSWSSLRRKFSRDNMKEFANATKLSLSRVYPDCRLIVGSDESTVKRPQHASFLSSISQSPSSCSSSSSSSASPPYLSPDSISADSGCSSKSCSGSPSETPKLSLHPPLSSTQSDSDISILCSKISDPWHHSTPSTSMKFPHTLGERRGGFSKSLKLPVANTDTQTIGPSSRSISGHEKPDARKNIVCVSSNPGDFEIIFKSNSRERDSSHSHTMETVSESVASICLIKDAGYCNNNGESQMNNSLFEERKPVHQCRTPAVHSWPTLEKLENFGKGDLDSRAAFVITDSKTGHEGRIIYFWLGRSFSLDRKWTQKCTGTGEDLGEADHKRISVHVLAQWGLSEDTEIKVVREGQEPLEFEALLSLL
uniref:Uncharacterized protein n=1 Tax=Kalanchoe fedtschenkoi TaxID=63787 RepID=A0A7N0V3N7_KALFE